MPIVLIIIGLAVAVGVGSFFLRPQDVVETTPIENVMPADTSETSLPNTEIIDTTTADTTTTEDTNTPKETTTPVSVATPKASETEIVPTTPAAAATVYKNGAHSVTSSYTAPGNAHHTMTVTLTLVEDKVTDSNIVFGGDKVGESTKYQNRFAAAYKTAVVGKTLDTIKLSRVGGASLTTGGFNDAIANIKKTALQ